MIVIVAAMEEEVRLFTKEDMSNVKILLTGIGKVNAAMTLTDFIATHQVEAIYNLGFAGATQPFMVGDLVLIEDACYHDFDLTLFGYEKGQVPGFPKTYTSNNQLIKNIVSVLPEIKRGHLLTGDYFMTKQLEDAYVLDMEGTALYQVAYQKQIPIVSVKVISDVMGMDDHFASYKKFESSIGAHMLNELFIKLL